MRGLKHFYLVWQRVPQNYPRKVSCWALMSHYDMHNDATNKARRWDWWAMHSGAHRQLPMQKQRAVSFPFTLASSAVSFPFTLASSAVSFPFTLASSAVSFPIHSSFICSFFSFHSSFICRCLF